MILPPKTSKDWPAIFNPRGVRRSRIFSAIIDEVLYLCSVGSDLELRTDSASC